MQLDYQNIINLLGEIIQYCLPLGILIGLIERLMRMIIRAATGRSAD